MLVAVLLNALSAGNLLTKEQLEQKVAVLPNSIKLGINDKTSMKKLIETVTDFGYLRTSRIEKEGEYSTRGDIIDIWQPGHPYPVRIMFFGDTIEAIKLINAGNFSSIKNLDTCEIAPISEHCKVEGWHTVREALVTRKEAFVTDDSHGYTLHDGEKMTIFITAPVANFFSALSVLIPEIVWNVGTRGKTVLVFVGSSRSPEKYMDTKGVPYVISSVDDFAPNAINIIRKDLGASFELVDEKLVVYSLHKIASREPTPSPLVPPLRPEGEFALPEIGGLVIHEQHGLGRYLGIKKMQLADGEREYIVLQYDGGAFVYLPPDRTHELFNYFGSPRRLDRI